uniref:Uncharacterized protein n=1 Tax=Arundo donax TaxID=35708 RepID=A0A0A8ZE48_ARUDO
MEAGMQKLSGRTEIVVKFPGYMWGEEMPTKILQADFFLEACSDTGDFRERQYLLWRTVWMIPVNTGVSI